MEMEHLRKRCKILMVELGYDRMGCLIELADELKINRNSLSMALTGYRDGEGAKKHLESLRLLLARKAAEPKTAA